MSVLKRGTQYWYIQFQFRSKTYIRSSRTTDKKAAEQMEREWKRQLHAQAFLGHKERITIQDAMNQFVDSKKGTANHKNLLTHSKSLARLFRTSRYLDEVTSEDLERLKRDRYNEGCAPATLKHTFNTLRGACKYAKRMGYQVSDFEFPEVKLPNHRLRYLSLEEEKRLFKELDPKREGTGLIPYKKRPPGAKEEMLSAYQVVILLLDTGARYSEIAGLEWRQINLTDRTIQLWRPKVQNESVIYMTDRVYRLLSQRDKEKTSKYVFTNRKGEKRGYATQSIRKAFRRAGLSDCTIHTLRHTTASRLIQNGMNLYEVKEILGHSDIKTTMRYAHLEQRDVSSRARDVIERLNKKMGKPTLKVV